MAVDLRPQRRARHARARRDDRGRPGDPRVAPAAARPGRDAAVRRRARGARVRDHRRAASTAGRSPLDGGRSRGRRVGIVAVRASGSSAAASRCSTRATSCAAASARARCRSPSSSSPPSGSSSSRSPISSSSWATRRSRRRLRSCRWRCVVIPLSRVAPMIAGRVGVRVAGRRRPQPDGDRLRHLLHARHRLVATGTSSPALLPFGAGMALAGAPATTAIVASLPREKQGVASAVNDVSRELGGALGIAVLGSLFNSGYRSQLASHTANLPPAVAHAASSSLAAAQQVGRQPRRSGPAAHRPRGGGVRRRLEPGARRRCGRAPAGRSVRRAPRTRPRRVEGQRRAGGAGGHRRGELISVPRYGCTVEG